MGDGGGCLNRKGTPMEGRVKNKWYWGGSRSHWKAERFKNGGK